MRLRTVCVLVAGILLVGAPVTAEEKPAAAEKTWQDEPRRHGLSKADIAALEKDRILVTDEGYKQIFSAYLVRRCAVIHHL